MHPAIVVDSVTVLRPDRSLYVTGLWHCRSFELLLVPGDRLRVRLSDRVKLEHPCVWLGVYSDDMRNLSERSRATLVRWLDLAIRFYLDAETAKERADARQALDALNELVKVDIVKRLGQ